MKSELLERGWKCVSLGSVCNITSSKRIFAKEYQSSGIPFYRGKEIIEKHKGSSVSTELFISPERFGEIQEKFGVPQIGDVLLTSVGTLGVPWLVDETNFYFKDGNLTWLRAGDGLLGKYLYLWLNSPEAQSQIDTKCIGSTQKALTIEALNKFQISLPPLSEQKRICVTLYSVLDKIKLNRKINDNFAEFLQCIYQQQFCNIAGDTLSGRLADICSYSKGKVAVSHLTLGNYYSTENMLVGKAGSVDATSLPATEHTTRCSTGDVLISNIRPYFKKIVYCQSECGCSTDVLCFRPNSPELSAYLFSTLYADRFFDFMVAGSKGTKMPRGDKQQIMTYAITVPSSRDLRVFNTVAGPILFAIEQCRKESKCLEQLRDAFLPKLMSGEIDVSDIQL